MANVLYYGDIIPYAVREIWQPAARQKYRLLALAAVVLVITSGGILATTDSAGAQTSLDTSDFNVQGTNTTTSGSVSDVTLSASVDYSHSVPDATRRIVKLKVGPKGGSTVLVDYRQTREPEGTASGTLELSGSVLEHGELSAESFNPPLAETTSRELLVEAVIEVQRAGGDAVTKTVSDTVTVTVNDGATLSVAVGGSGSVSVESSG